MTPLDRTASGTGSSAARFYPWLPFMTTVAVLATVLVLSFTHNTAAAVAIAAAVAASSVRITVHIRR
ncbi:hypothetical protein [Streptomyces sp. MMBL 11-3]|uniref:hypothetical protein n=1 Tax=Streptomyces sp. MMBL 11-3 TaxID=3382639 RepID=UPI0039B457B0